MDQLVSALVGLAWVEQEVEFAQSQRSNRSRKHVLDILQPPHCVLLSVLRARQERSTPQKFLEQLHLKLAGPDSHLGDVRMGSSGGGKCGD